MTTIILVAALTLWMAWALACWLSVYSLIENIRPMHPLAIAESVQAELHLAGIKLYEADKVEGYAFACFFGFERAIVFNATFLTYAPEKARRFCAAHEFGHHQRGHVAARLWLRILLLDRFSYVRRRLELTEDSANRFAERLTGLESNVLWGPIVVSEVAGRGHPTEEVDRA